MPRKHNPRTVAAAFLALSAALSIALLAVRNLYDDEISSIPLVTESIRHILLFTSETNVHPPGMYLLAHLAYLIVPSIRWINLFPLGLLYAGLAFFLLQVTPLFDRTRSRVCLLLLATLHPQLLMWGATFRWYGWWTGLALIVLTLSLQPRKTEPALSLARAFTLGLLMASLFYLGYLTLLFAFALGAAMAYRYRTVPRSRLLVPCAFAVVIFIVLILPQIPTMLNVHLPNSQNQRSGLAASFLRLLTSIATSEAYLPWHPLAIVASLIFGLLCIAGGVALYRLRRATDTASGTTSALASIALFAFLFFVLVAVTRLGGKPRSALLLIPTLAPVAAWIIGTLRSRMQNAILIFFALWSAVGITHLLGRYGLAKASMNDRPERVVAFVQQTSGSGCSVVVTYDPGLAYSLTRSDLPRLLLMSPRNQEDQASAPTALPAGECSHTTLYVVQSYSGADPTYQQALTGELQIATQYIQGQSLTRFFGIDPDAPLKRQLTRLPLIGRELAPAALLPDYRYVVTTGPIDSGRIEAMRQRMPHFVNGTEALDQPN